MLRVLAITSRAALRFGAVLILGISLLTGVGVEVATNTGCGDEAIMSSCCCGDDVGHCADPMSAACAARCLCGVTHPFGLFAAAASPSAQSHVLIVQTERAAPRDRHAPPLTPPPIVRL